MIYLFKMVISLWESQLGNPQTQLGTNFVAGKASSIPMKTWVILQQVTTNIIVTITITKVAITKSLAVNSDMNNMMMKP